MNTILIRRASVALALAGALAGASVAAAVPSTMPANNPAQSAGTLTVMQQVVKATALAKPAANNYFYLSNGGGQVKLSKFTTSGFDGQRTVTITPPSGMQFMQGFATISGGDVGAVVIRSTTATPKAFTIKLAYPGEQGTTGKVNFRIQLVAATG